MTILDKLFGKRKRRIHRIEEETIDDAGMRQMEQLLFASNCRPVGYYYTEPFFNLYTNGEEVFRVLIEETNADDLNSAMFLPMIRAARDAQRAFAYAQYQDHVDVSIDNIDRKVVGALELAHDLLGRLENAKKATDTEYETLLKLKENELRGHLNRSGAVGTDRSGKGE